jgi:hypothetical protein
LKNIYAFAGDCFTYDQFWIRESILKNMLMSQGLLRSRLQAAFHKFYGRYTDLLCRCNLPLGQMLLYVWYQSLTRSWHTHLDYCLNHLPDDCGGDDRQGMITPRHMIPPLYFQRSVYVGVLTLPRHMIPPLYVQRSVYVGVLTLPRHMIPPLVCPEIPVCPILWFVFSTGLMRLLIVHYLCHFIRHNNDNSISSKQSLRVQNVSVMYVCHNYQIKVFFMLFFKNSVISKTSLALDSTIFLLHHPWADPAFYFGGGA